MKKLLKFETFVNESQESEKNLDKLEIIDELEQMQKVYSREDLMAMNMDQLDDLYHDVLVAGNDSDEEKTSELEYESKKWIQDAIKRPGALRRSMKKKRGEKISKTEIDSELQALTSRDKDTEKPGLQLSKSDRRRQRQLVLAKTLRDMK